MTNIAIIIGRIVIGLLVFGIVTGFCGIGLNEEWSHEFNVTAAYVAGYIIFCALFFIWTSGVPCPI